jgi:hypothetical protein
MSKERDKFLTEALYQCYSHTLVEIDNVIGCSTCGLEIGYGTLDESIYEWYKDTPPFDFNTWEGFGVLFVWCRRQDWWNSEFTLWVETDEPVGFKEVADSFIKESLINPSRFADAVYDFLKEKC